MTKKRNMADSTLRLHRALLKRIVRLEKAVKTLKRAT
jgi:hypothetical protein